MSTQADSESGIGRRRFLQGVGATTAAGVGLAYGARPAAAFDWKELATSDTAKLVGATALAGPVGLGWALRDVGVLGSDAPPEGLTASSLRQQVHQTVLTRESANASAFIDNQNIVDGLDNTLYIEGKIAAIEALNDQMSQSEVESAALDAMNTQLSTVEKNLLKSWNESLNEFDSWKATVESHPDVLMENIAPAWHDPDDQAFNTTTFSYTVTDSVVTLSDGSDFTTKLLELATENYTSQWNPDSLTEDTDNLGSYVRLDALSDSSPVRYLEYDSWSAIWSQIQTVGNNVNDGLITWVSNVYADVQSGEIDLSDLVTPAMRAEMMADEESAAQAIADLAALNIPVDVEREATVTIEETSATLRGTLAITDESDGPIESGTTYDPSTLSGDVYLTFDTSLLEGDWSAFEAGVDGGNMTITDEPYPGTVYRVDTTANETATINSTDWQATGNGTWYYDASSQLETGITEISEIDYFAANDEPNFQTIKLDSSFTVETFTNTETGEESGQASFSSSEPQDDTNYITQEEWDQLEKQNEELIQKYEESQDSGGGGITIPGFGDVEGFGAIAGGVAFVGGVVVVLKKFADFYLPG